MQETSSKLSTYKKENILQIKVLAFKSSPVPVKLQASKAQQTAHSFISSPQIVQLLKIRTGSDGNTENKMGSVEGGGGGGGIISQLVKGFHAISFLIVN